MSMLKSKTYSGKKRGRPLGRLLKKPEQKSTISMRISPELYELIEPELRKNETYSDTILRVIRYSRWSNINAQKKVRALEEHLHMLETEYLYVKEPNK